jgi:predicted TIM-barrel fold metal-dependent hydrolase
MAELIRLFPLLAAVSLIGAELRIEVTDESGRPLWTRLEVRGADGKMFQPDQAIRDRSAHVKVSGPSWYLGHFVVEGKATLSIPAGRYAVVAEHGTEYERSEQVVDVGSAEASTLRITLRPWIRMNDLGWYSADMHVHRPLEDVPALMRTEGLNLAVSYTMWNTTDGSRSRWRDHPVPANPVETVSPTQLQMIMNAEDERGGGAWMLIGLPAPFDMPAASEWYPQGLTFVERARELRRAGSVLPWFECEKLIWWEVPVMMALGRPDSVSLLFNHFNQYGMHDQEAWGRARDQKEFPGPEGFVRYVLGLNYRYLNLGFQFALTAGSASGVLQGPVGYNRVYAKLDGPFTAENWFRSLKDGQSFVTNGPMLFTKFTTHGGKVDVEVDARSREPIDRIEIIGNGQLLRVVRPQNEAREFRQTVTVETGNHSWLAVRCWQRDVPGFRLAHSAPYRLDGKWDASEDARYFTGWIDELIRITNEDPKRFANEEQKNQVLAVYQKARAVYAAAIPASTQASSLRSLRPIDAHAHVFVVSPGLSQFRDRYNLTSVNIAVIDPYDRGYESLEPQRANVLKVYRQDPAKAPWVTTFAVEDFESPGYAARVIAQLKEDFRNGASGVKIYKTLGMHLKSRSGRYVMCDDPAFSPILDFIAAQNKTLYAHIAEPAGAWKPLDADDPDASYYKEAPEWHMYGHPEKPSKAAILAARDRMVAAHPSLRIVGCHLGSMEEDVDEIARHLDRYPNLAVDTAARVTHMALQPHDKVRAFVLKYQDRILYATDDGVAPGENVAARLKHWQSDLERDYKYFSATEPVAFEGKKLSSLGLPESVLRKLYRENALKWVPDIQKKSKP